MKKTTWQMLLSLVLVVCMLAACGTNNSGTSNTGNNSGTTNNQTSDTGDTSTGADTTTLRIGLHGDTGGFDPQTGTSGTPQYVIKPTYRGLFSVAGDGSLKNEICESYTVSDDGLVYTFTLRDDAKWSDGVPVTAADFVYGWQRNLDPELACAYSNLLSAIVNFDACLVGDKPVEELGVKALDDTTLEVTLSHTQPYFVQMTTFSPFYPVREDKVPTNSSTWSITDVANVVTNGPMKFESYSQNDKVVLVRNPEYYAPEEYGTVERMEFYYIADAQTSVAAFVNNELDVAINVPSDIAATHDNPNEVVEVPYLVSVCYVFTGRNPVLDDVRVRQAINKAINREQICEILGVGNNPIYGLVPPGITNPATGEDFRAEGGDLIGEDVAEAQQLLADAGYPNGEGFPELTFLSSNSTRNSDIALAIQSMLKENLGIIINLQLLESQAFSAERRAGNFDICALGTSADYNDPTTWLSLYDSSTEYIQMVAAYSTPEFDELLHAADLELDQAKRFEMLHEAERILVSEDSQWIPVMTYNIPIMVKEYVKGIETTTAGDIYFTGVTIEK